MKPTAVAIVLCFAAFVGCAVSVHAAELRFAGVLGNSGESGDTLVAFSERQASGIGPVIDDEQTLWERAGAGRLNRYALDGRLLASFAIPTSTSHSDQMTRADDRLVLLLGKTAYWLSLTSQPDSKPVRIDDNVDRMSSNAKDGQVVIVDGDQLFWLDVTSAKRTLIRKIAFRVAGLHIGSDDTLYVFGDGNVYAWQNGEPVEGFPKPFHAERPQKIDNWWYGHAWHGTIKRFNEQFEPEPGVVAGGASGSFIGYLPESSDLNNGRGMVQINDDLFAVSGFAGVVQLLKWNDNDTRFELVRRLGALANLQGVALDAEGNIWTPRGAWRWPDSPEAPHTLGDVEPQTIAQPVVLDGKTSAC